MKLSPLVNRLIQALQCLPGVGGKSAQRMAFYLLDQARDDGKRLAQAVEMAVKEVGDCIHCRTYSESRSCLLCEDAKRLRHQLCIVETPSDLMMIEQTGTYKGLYFVLKGCLSPLDGMGPEQIGLDKLNERLAQNEVEEIILATNTTVEGETTAHYIAKLAQNHGVRTSRLAHGVPLGGELAFVDINTLTHAVSARIEMA